MNISNKKQVAGDESSQFQAETINQTNNVTIVNNGVSVSDVIALFKQQFRLALSDFGNIAEQKANERISKFEEEFFSKIANSDISLDSFKKPELHVFLSDACKSAIQSDSNNDYKLLSELLIKRIKEDNNRKICAGLKFATQIIPELDKDSLFGLTISFVFLKLVASADNPIDALRILDSIYGSLMYQEIPKSNNWIGLLDMLRCVRIVNFSKAKPYINTFCDQYDGFCCVGIKSQSPEYENTIKLLQENNIPPDILIPHEFNEGYYRLKVSSKNQIDKLHEYNPITRQSTQLSTEQKNVLYSIYDSYEKNTVLTEKIKNDLKNEICKYKNIVSISSWFEKLPYLFEFTSAGEIIANINAKLLDQRIPDYDIK